MSPEKEKVWLTREDIDKITGDMSAADMLDAIEDEQGKRQSGTKMIRSAFDSAAEAQGYGEKATTRVPVSEFRYLSERLGGVINIESPLSPATSDSLDSAATGA